MRIHKPIDLNLKKEGKYFIAGDLPTLQIILGTTSVSGNFRCYDVVKGDGKNFRGFKVPISKVKEQIERMKERITSIENRMDVMQQVVSGDILPSLKS
jgi:hypothetical protein